MSNPNNGQVSVFHFTSRISNAKIKKYKMATERGMGPKSNGLRASHANKPSKSATPHGDDASPAVEASTSMEPPAKKPRLKINPPRKPDDAGDTIAVSRPKRPNQPIRFRYSTDMDIADEPQAEEQKPVESAPVAVSPAPSSGLSSLSSAPLSEKELSPFQDPKPAAGREGYGDFMSYYVDGGDEEPAAAEEVPAPKPATKPAAKRPRKSSTKVQKETSTNIPVPSSQHPATNEPHPSPGARAPLPQQQAMPPPQHANLPQQYQSPSMPHQGSPSHPQRPQQMHRPSIPPPHTQRALPIPQPIIQFSDINHIPKPTQPDTIALMVKKLEELSAALTTFGGVPAIPRSPPTAARSVPVAAPPQPKPAPKAPVEEAANPLDNFLSLFGAGDDDDTTDKDPLDCQLAAAGTPDGPLTHGIVFIQNALKSWAQQRISHAYQQQYIQQQQQQHRISAQRRGPGRPRKFDDVVELLPPNPIISMDLASTPEGQAIIAFQAVLHSGCLQVNAKLPIELSRALRHLYMQIDHLINQGEKPTPQDWHCMSYGAQISAHRMRVEKMKMTQMRAQEEMMRQNGFAQQQIMGPMGMPNPSQYPVNAAQAARAHEMELERRRSMQHANQQPYIGQQHLHSLQLGSQKPGAPGGAGPSQSPSGNQPLGSARGPPGPSNGDMRPPMQHVLPSQPHFDPAQTLPDGNMNGGVPVHLDKMKMYMPGFFPRSGQAMKYSFSPTTEHSVHTPGPQGIPPYQIPGQSVPSRGPVSAPSMKRAAQGPPNNGRNESPDHDAVVSSNIPVRSVERPSAPPPRTSLTPLTPAAPVEGTQNGNFRSYAAAPAAATTNGFTAVNAPKPRTSITVPAAPSDSPETIKVASKRPSSALSPSESPAPSAKRSRKSMKSVDRDDSNVVSSDGDGETIVVK
ncbi:unnamed protein product [Zymoseptoria tritici ST99CH_1A5]|uniref:Uncharacterized protein n=1 Tax=Zymoseptoria tritici ST99CH_1A5 TaxID=1276529 RepID=A0A1Y6L8I9_ZYMTR|nr:unnamed protein product [Zymoseptoria tritici ST99CH_1A5]